MSATPVLATAIPGLPLRRGKVRDVYDCGDHVLLVATDRVSAFDVVMPTGIPDKGRVLTALSAFWFGKLAAAKPHHLLQVIENSPPRPDFAAHMDELRGRATWCLKSEVLPVECVVRGYLAGSGWKEYRETGRVCGVALPAGLRQCDRLPEPIFTPATKAETGHDENISFEQMAAIVGRAPAEEMRERSMRLYREAAEYARQRGVIIADTKFEFGRRGDELLLIDEILTPDSSRFWPADEYEPGHDQPSYDKQFVRNYLETLVTAGEWNKQPPGPALPERVVAGTVERYHEALRRLTGEAG